MDNNNMLLTENILSHNEHEHKHTHTYFLHILVFTAVRSVFPTELYRDNEVCVLLRRSVPHTR